MGAYKNPNPPAMTSSIRNNKSMDGFFCVKIYFNDVRKENLTSD